MIDTHTHIYDSAFDADRAEVVQRAREAGLDYLLLPAIDSSTHQAMFDLEAEHPGFCRTMMGVHPTSISAENIDRELGQVKDLLAEDRASGLHRFCAVGEVGLDLYWSEDCLDEQIRALEFQIELSLDYGLPLVVHTRDAWPQMLDVLARYKGQGLRGVMHSFSGDEQIYSQVKMLGDFLFGIGGVVTFKKGDIARVVPAMDLGDLVLETDSPYLTPVPFRGKRNESSYVGFVAEKVAELKGVDLEQVIRVTDNNARRMFGL